MEFLVILVGFIALLMAMSARKGVASLQLQLNGVLARLSRLQDELEDLRRQRPNAPAPEAPAPASQVPVTPAVAAPAPPPEAATPPPEPPPAVAPASGPEAAVPAPDTRPDRYHAGGEARHALGGVGRRPPAGIGWPAAGAFLDRARHLRPRRAHRARSPIFAGVDCRRRMVPPQRARFAGRGDSRRARAEHPHRRRHCQCVRHRLCRLRALPVHRPGRGFRPARHHRRRHHAGRRPARTGAGGPRSGGLASGAAARVVADAEPLAAGDLSRRRRRRSLRARPLPSLAVARLRGGGGRVLLGPGPVGPDRRQHCRRLGVGAVRAHRLATGTRGHLPGARAASRHAGRGRSTRLGCDGGAGRTVGARGTRPGCRPVQHAVDRLRHRRHGDPCAHLVAQRTRRRGCRAGRCRLARRHRRLARPDGRSRAAPARSRHGRGAAGSRQRLPLHDLHNSFLPRHRPAGDVAPGARPRAARRPPPASTRWPPSCPRCWR